MLIPLASVAPGPKLTGDHVLKEGAPEVQRLTLWVFIPARAQQALASLGPQVHPWAHGQHFVVQGDDVLMRARLASQRLGRVRILKQVAGAVVHRLAGDTSPVRGRQGFYSLISSLLI